MMYDALQKGPYKVAGFHDPDSKRLIGLLFRPATWAAATVYYHNDNDNYDVVIPTVFAGVYYKVEKPGKSGATEPTWNPEEGDETTDGTLGLVWKAVNYNLMVPAETISAVTATANNGVTVSSVTNSSRDCSFMIDVLPAGLQTFQVTVHVTKSNAEEFDVTLEFKVNEQ